MWSQVWILKGKREEDELYRSMWERSMDEMLDRLVFRNNASGLTYLSEISACGSSSKPPDAPKMHAGLLWCHVGQVLRCLAKLQACACMLAGSMGFRPRWTTSRVSRQPCSRWACMRGL